MLASDVNNPEFSGAQDPDSKLFVEFYMHDPIDWNKSQETRRTVRAGKEVPYVRIQVPGDKTSIIETPVRDEHKVRFNKQWLYFEMREGLVGQDMPIPGWPLEEWSHLDKERVRDLKFLRFSVVEQIAGASDGQCQKMGMDGFALREKARADLKARAQTEARAEIEKKDQQIAELQKQMEELKAMVLAKPDIQPQAPKKRGRPKKVPDVQPEQQVSG